MNLQRYRQTTGIKKADEIQANEKTKALLISKISSIKSLLVETIESSKNLIKTRGEG